MEKMESILNEDTWIQNDLAANEGGDPVDISAHDAVRFCLIGALMRTHGVHVSDVIPRPYDYENEPMRQDCIKLVRNIPASFTQVPHWFESPDKLVTQHTGDPKDWSLPKLVGLLEKYNDHPEIQFKDIQLLLRETGI